MSHLVLARKYRPLGFATVSGQEHVTRTLTNSIKRDRISHALLLTGPRGVGKTSIARIFAKCLNCQTGTTATPCLECINCKEIAAGTSTAVREIDGASHNSVDNVRELIEGFRTLPAPGSKYKVYIIDEVHMLSTAAFNALLKSLEEPPPHTVFILATTEVHKIPETVLSRCQRHDLRAIPSQSIYEVLSSVCQKENVQIEPAALSIVAQVAQGSMRDAQTALERLMAFGDDSKITAKDAINLFGFADKQALFNLTQAIIDRDPKQALHVLHDILSTGIDSVTLIRDFVSHCRELLIANIGGEAALKDHIAVESQIVELLRQAKTLQAEEAKDISTLSRELGDQALRSSFPEYALESMIVRLSTRAKPIEIKSLLSALSKGGVSLSSPAKSQASATTSSKLSSVDKSKTPTASISSSVKKDWATFVNFTQGKARILAEQLKRMSVATFSDGQLILEGIEFSANYIEKKENKDALVKLLQEFSPAANGWKVVVKIAESKDGAAAGSLIEVEASEQKKIRASKESKALESPHIQAIQNLFPGSKINVKVKE
jgi:DNA polymerase-3 subunit gamma/tau